MFWIIFNLFYILLLQMFICFSNNRIRSLKCTACLGKTTNLWKQRPVGPADSLPPPWLPWPERRRRRGRGVRSLVSPGRGTPVPASLVPQPWMYTSVLWIRIWFQCGFWSSFLYVNADSDPGSQTKLMRIRILGRLYSKKSLIFTWKILKYTYEDTKAFLRCRKPGFLIFWIISMLLDPDSHSHCGSIRIQMHSTTLMSKERY
jgi:hypothetical protein